MHSPAAAAHTGAPRFLGIDARGREILSFIDGFAPPHNGCELRVEAVRAGARLVRQVHDLTEGTEFSAGSEVACHRNLSQPNFIFRDMIPVAIIDWDTTRPGTRLANFAEGGTVPCRTDRTQRGLGAGYAPLAQPRLSLIKRAIAGCAHPAMTGTPPDRLVRGQRGCHARRAACQRPWRSDQRWLGRMP